MSADVQQKIRICHISDLHLPLDRKLPLHRLLGKRSLGYMNLRLIRSKIHDLDPFEPLIRHMVQSEPDLVLVTGDLTSLAFAFEFERVDRILTQGGLSPENTILIPGNHDRYTFGADWACAFEQGMARWLPQDFKRARDYPIVKVVGPVVVAALDTAVWRNAVRAAGRIDVEQIERLRAVLDEHRSAGRWPVIAMHHPPFRLENTAFRNFRTGLAGVEIFHERLREYPATIVHGHLHFVSRRKVGQWEILGVPSATNNAGIERAQLAYHVYEFDRAGLTSAVAVRYWPDRDNPFETVDLPDEVLIG